MSFLICYFEMDVHGLKLLNHFVTRVMQTKRSLITIMRPMHEVGATMGGGKRTSATA